MLDHPLALELLKAVSHGDAEASELAKLAVHQVIAEDPAYQEVLEMWRRRREVNRSSPLQVASALVKALDRLPEIERRKRRARQWLALFRDRPVAERRKRVQRLAHRIDPQALALCLIEASKNEAHYSPTKAFEFADAAIHLLERSAHGEALGSVLLAQAFVWAGNAQRAAGNLITAESLLNAARGVETAAGGLDCEVRAELAAIEGSLARARRRFPEAISSLEEAVSLYGLLEDRPAQVRALMALAKTYHAAGDPAQALEVIYQLLPDLDPQHDLGLYLGARLNLALYFHASGQHQEALDRLTYDEELFASSADPTLHRCACWLEGKIWAGLGDEARAERLLWEMKGQMIQAGNGFDVALVSLDLALLYLSRGRTAEVKALAAEAVTLFEAQAVHREALAALVLFQQAAEAEHLGAEFVARLGRFLEAAKRNPGLRWEEVA